jgi:ribosomal protein S18 acetylase RimI-like enzyme
MSMPLEIRRATAGDVDALVAVAGQAFREAYEGLDDPADIEDYVATSLTPAYFAPHVGAAPSRLFLAHVGGALVGYALVTRSAPPACVTGPAPVELARLYLVRAALGQGHGDELMRSSIAAARELGGQTLWLSVYDRNVRAVRFYAKWGFADVGTKDFVFGGQIYADPVMAVAL